MDNALWDQEVDVKVVQVDEGLYEPGEWLCKLYVLKMATGYTGTADVHKHGELLCKVVSATPLASPEDVLAALRERCDGWIAGYEQREGGDGLA